MHIKFLVAGFSYILIENMFSIACWETLIMLLTIPIQKYYKVQLTL